MTAKERSRIEQRLLEERERTLKLVNELRADVREPEVESTGDLSLMPTHPADRASDVQEREMDETLAEREATQLELIDDALRRLREDPEHFDVSVVSGEKIPFARLELVPWTRVLAGED